ncbi:MAG: hypothetical protein M3R70_06295 [Actinomycetota bacterium]|nr:hypothetical protein [Actinomycetota bacterium]
MTALELVRDALARVTWIREEYDPLVREQALEDLELDLAAALSRFAEEREPLTADEHRRAA